MKPISRIFNHDFKNGNFKLYDKKGNKIYYEDSEGYWEKSKFNSNNNKIYFGDSKGYWDKREYDSNNNLIYFKDLTGFWEEKKYDKNNNVIYSEDSTGYWKKAEYDSNNNVIFYEDSNNCKKSESNKKNMEKVIKTERGWGGHFCCADKCNFKRNTLLEYNNIKIVVSTVGDMVINQKSEIIGVNRYYETMAFYAKKIDIYYDADVSKKVPFDSNWTITEITTHTDQTANDMHESIVLEISEKLKNGIIV